MFTAYADRRPDPDGPIDPRIYGIQEFISDEELEEQARACGIVPKDPGDQAA